MKKINKWRNAKVANGWKIIHRVVPPYLFLRIDKLIADDKSEHYDLWHSVPKVEIK